MTTERKQKLDALINDLQAVAAKHNAVVDKYVKDDGSTEYWFKLQFDDAEVNLEKVFSVVHHGLSGKRPN